MALLAVLVVVGLIGTSKMQIGGQAPGAGAFYMDSPYAVETANIAKKFPGAISYSLIIKGSAENDIQRQDVLKNIEHLQDYLNLDPKVGGSLSVIDFLKRMNVVIHDGDERYYHLPRIGDPDIGYYEDTEMVQRAVGEYLFMYSLGTAGEFDFLIDYEYKNTNINVFLKDMEAQTIRDVIAKTKDYVAKNWTAKGVTVEIAGGLAGVVGAINEELGSGLLDKHAPDYLHCFLLLCRAAALNRGRNAYHDLPVYTSACVLWRHGLCRHPLKPLYHAGSLPGHRHWRGLCNLCHCAHAGGVERHKW